MFYSLQDREICRRLVAAAERGDVALKASLQLQSERRRNNHVTGRLVFACVEMAGVKIDGEEDRMRKRGTEGLDNEQRVIGIRAQDANGSRTLPFVLNARD